MIAEDDEIIDIDPAGEYEKSHSTNRDDES